MKKQFIVTVEYPDCDTIVPQEFKDCISEYFDANIMDGEEGRLKTKIKELSKTDWWIARDKGRTEKESYLYIYSKEPEKMLNYFHFTGGFMYQLDNRAFPEVTFDNSPLRISLPI